MKIRGKRKETKEIKITPIDRTWKECNKEYLKELQRFFDRVDSIEDSEVRRNVTNQMMLCDKVLTELAENMFVDFYHRGYESSKNG